MNDFQTINGIWLVGALILVVSSLAARNLRLGTVVRSVLAWAAILLVVVVGVAHRYEIKGAFAMVSDRLGLSEQQAAGKTVRIRMDPDGHFWANVSLNGTERRMLIDSGATTTAISQETANAAGVETDSSEPKVYIETANGTVGAKRGSIDKLSVGPLSMQGLGVVISAQFGDLDVLGMNFLSRLKSWRVEDNMLVLDPGGKESRSEGASAQNRE